MQLDYLSRESSLRRALDALRELYFIYPRDSLYLLSQVPNFEAYGTSVVACSTCDFDAICDRLLRLDGLKHEVRGDVLTRRILGQEMAVRRCRATKFSVPPFQVNYRLPHCAQEVIYIISGVDISDRVMFDMLGFRDPSVFVCASMQRSAFEEKLANMVDVSRVAREDLQQIYSVTGGVLPDVLATIPNEIDSYVDRQPTNWVDHAASMFDLETVNHVVSSFSQQTRSWLAHGDARTWLLLSTEDRTRMLFYDLVRPVWYIPESVATELEQMRSASPATVVRQTSVVSYPRLIGYEPPGLISLVARRNANLVQIESKGSLNPRRTSDMRRAVIALAATGLLLGGIVIFILISYLIRSINAEDVAWVAVLVVCLCFAATALLLFRMIRMTWVFLWD